MSRGILSSRVVQGARMKRHNPDEPVHTIGLRCKRLSSRRGVEGQRKLLQRRRPTLIEQRAALRGLPHRERPDWLIECFIEIDNLPVGRHLHAKCKSSSPCTAQKRVSTPALPGSKQAFVPDTGEEALRQAQEHALQVRTSPTVNAQHYRQEALDFLAQLGLGAASVDAEPQQHAEPADLRLLPEGFDIEQECSWDDWRVRDLNLKFAREDERVGTLSGPLPRGFRFAVLTERKEVCQEPVGYVLWRDGLSRATDSIQIQLESPPQILHFFIDPTYRGNRALRLGQRLLTWWRVRHALHAFAVVEPNGGMQEMLRRNGCMSKYARDGVERAEMFTCLGD